MDYLPPEYVDFATQVFRHYFGSHFQWDGSSKTRLNISSPSDVFYIFQKKKKVKSVFKCSHGCIVLLTTSHTLCDNTAAVVASLLRSSLGLGVQIFTVCLKAGVILA
jgi:hypothetical protein